MEFYDEAALLERVEPIYPKEAIDKGIRGTVLLNVVRGKDGRVLRADVVSGNPILAKAARQAVMGWRFKPYVLNGEAIEKNMKIRITFPRAKPGKRPGAVGVG